jgi:hypothetical protein
MSQINEKQLEALPEDILEMADTICRGDIVWFDRIGPQSVLMRVVPDGDLRCV